MITNSQWINSWEDAFKVSLGNVNLYKKRLRELSSWDKPTVSKRADKTGKWREWACKKIALKGLILEQYPNSVFTTDNKVILKK